MPVTSAGGASSGRPPILSVRNLAKSFGGARALKGISLDVMEGEVHGLLGQNGSGKSTFVKLMAGFHAPDPGASLEINGREVRLPLSAGEFRRLGLSFVHQNLGLIPSLSVLENLRVGSIIEKGKAFISWGAERRAAREAFERFDIDIDPLDRIADLSQVDRALVAIVRAFEEVRETQEKHGLPGILLLDEPTPFLPRAGVDKLFDLVRRIVEHGAAVIFISHDIDEVLEITDRFTVLRDGDVVGTRVTQDTSRDEIIEMIVGKRVEQFHMARADGGPTGKARVQVSGLTGGVLRDVDFAIHGGEVLGMTGLIGSGYEQVPYRIYGARTPDAGSMLLDDDRVDLTHLTPRDAVAMGMALLPADRQGASGVGSLPIGENMVLPDVARFFRGGMLRRRQMTQTALDLGEAYEVRPNDPALPLSALSGGNAQKVLLAKWLSVKPRVLLLDEPTQGVDVGTRQQVFRAIRTAAQDGAAVVCASSDYEQLADICDRVLVFGRGQIVEELTGSVITKDRIAQACYSSVSSRALHQAPSSAPAQSNTATT